MSSTHFEKVAVGGKLRWPNIVRRRCLPRRFLVRPTNGCPLPGGTYVSKGSRSSEWIRKRRHVGQTALRGIAVSGASDVSYALITD